MVTNAHHSFLKPKLTASDLLCGPTSCLKGKQMQFNKILTFQKLKPVNCLSFFALKKWWLMTFLSVNKFTSWLIVLIAVIWNVVFWFVWMSVLHFFTHKNGIPARLASVFRIKKNIIFLVVNIFLGKFIKFFSLWKKEKKLKFGSFPLLVGISLF